MHVNRFTTPHGRDRRPRRGRLGFGAALLILLGAVAPLPAQQRAGGGNGKPEPTHAEVSYGPHEQNVLDFWKAPGDGPRPLALYIHGGGFRGGSKDSIRPRALRALLDAGISVAAIEYRFIQHAPLPAAHDDVARALQFLRNRSEDWSLDRERAGAFGGSAGAQLAMYLAFHDDRADPDADDPIARRSTRLRCVAAFGGQTTMDIRLWRKWIPGYDEPHREFSRIFGTEEPKKVQRIVEAISAIDLLSPDDPPIFMAYRMAPDDPVPEGRRARGWKVHHVNFGVKLKEKAERIGVEALLRYPGHRPEPGSGYRFLIQRLTAPER